MRRYFLTGCTGFIGKPLLEEILSRPDTESVCVMTRNAKQNEHLYKLHRKIILFEADIVDGRFPYGGEFTDVIHGASPPMSGPFQQDISYIITTGTRMLLEWMEEQQIKSLLFLSSGAASPSHPTPYGRAKYQAENLLKFGKIARLYAVVGDNTPKQYAIGKFIADAIENKAVSVQGGDNTYRTYIDAQDCAKWLLRILDHGTHRIPYDVGGHSVYSIRAVAQNVADVFGVPLNHTHKLERSHAYLPDLGAAHAIGCKNTIPLRTSLERIRDRSLATV